MINLVTVESTIKQLAVLPAFPSVLIVLGRFQYSIAE